MAVIDAKNMILGRMASAVAERLLKDESITIINAEEAVISGNRKQILARFKTRFDLGPKGNPERGPKYSRMPDRIVRRTVRGMLPFKSPRGRKAFKKLAVHISVPVELNGVDAETIPGAENKLRGKFMTVAKVSTAFGVKL